MLKGGCFCGLIRYETTGAPFHETSCHCANCRRTSGAPSVAWFTVQRAEFRFTRGSPARFKSTPDATRSFCSHCGTQLTFETTEFPTEIDVTTGSLDNPDAVPPKDQTWTRSKLSWVVLDDRLPTHEENAPAR